MFKSKVPDIFGKNNQFFVHSAYAFWCLPKKLRYNGMLLPT